MDVSLSLAFDLGLVVDEYRKYVKKEEPPNVPQTARLLSPEVSCEGTLDCLRMVNSLYVEQDFTKIECLHKILGIITEAEFNVFNDKNERILYAGETSTFLGRFLYPSRRYFILNIMDYKYGNRIVLKREFKYCSGCYWCAGIRCCSQEIIVESPPGTLIGTISQEASCCRASFAIKDANDNHVLSLRGPLGICPGPLGHRCENKFTLIGTDGKTEIGAIYRKYRESLNEGFVNLNGYLLEFPMDLDVKMKAMSLAALFLIQYMFFTTVPPCCH